MAQVYLDIEPTIKCLNGLSRPLTIFGIPVDREMIFSDAKGRYHNRIEKRQRKLIVKTTFIKFFLRPEERLRCLTTGYSPTSAAEQLLTGPAFLYFKRAVFIFTDQRILHVPTGFDHASRGAISQIMYEDCARIRIKGRSLCIKYKNGGKETFLYIGLREKNRINALIDHLPITPKEAGRLRGRVYLCPSCTKELPDNTSVCESCKLKFKSDAQARIRALTIPGGGYFYNRYPVLGFMVGILEIFLFGSIIFQTMNLYNGISSNFNLLMLTAVCLLSEKLITAFHSRRLVQDFVPEESDFAMRRI